MSNLLAKMKVAHGNRIPQKIRIYKND